jgi:hypothetical protein
MTEKEQRFARCEICGNELDTTRDDVAQWTEGWIPVNGGDDDEILFPVRRSRWAHGDCIDEQEKHGPNPNAE